MFSTTCLPIPFINKTCCLVLMSKCDILPGTPICCKRIQYFVLLRTAARTGSEVLQILNFKKVDDPAMVGSLSAVGFLGQPCSCFSMRRKLSTSFLLSVPTPSLSEKEAEPSTSKSAKRCVEVFLNTTLPLRVDPRVSEVLDAAFFARECGPDERGILFNQGKCGLGASSSC